MIDRRLVVPGLALALVLAACSSPPPPPPAGLTACSGDTECAAGESCTPAGICAVCGDGVARFGEPCDDGNAADDDGCLSTCQLARCGDGHLHAGVEVCDDGNTRGGDGCRADCGSDERCGNGILDAHLPRTATTDPGTCLSATLMHTNCTEVCDDGNTVSGDGCSENCLSAEVCGNGVLDPRGNGGSNGPEVCDDGNDICGDACENCIGDGCGNLCGDEFVGPQQECDPGAHDSPTCDRGQPGDPQSCTFAVCGDGYRNPAAGEQCDDANNVITDNCVACQTARCGDGAIDLAPPGLEQCDDGNAIATDNCTATCTVAVCGDGIVDSAPPGVEACDDGNAVNTDACRNDCTLPP